MMTSHHPVIRSLALSFTAIAFTSTAALASGGGGHVAMTLDQILWELGIKVLDVAIIAFFGFKFLSKPIAGLMQSRSEAVRVALEEAGAARREAEAKLKEFKEKTAQIDAEMEQLRKEACVEIDREQKIILEEAKAAEARIKQHAEETVRQELAKARADLHREAALLTVEIAATSVRQQMTETDRKRLVEEYVKEMETVR